MPKVNFYHRYSDLDEVHEFVVTDAGCGKLATPLETMKKHESKCFCNPKTKSCRICKHYIIDYHFVFCEIHKLKMFNLDKKYVYDKNDSLVWDGRKEEKLMEDIFYQPKERPFPKSNCMQFELGKKAY